MGSQKQRLHQRLQGRVIAGIFIISVSFFPSSARAEKVWEMQDTFRRQVGDVHLAMEKNTSRKAEPGAFWANAINSRIGISAIFRGVCTEVIIVKVHATDLRKIDLAPFLQSRTGKNLPIHEVVKVLRQGMMEQCEQLQVIRLQFGPSYPSQENYQYEGTLTKANGWRLEDGKVATDFDHTYTFEIFQRDPFSVAGVHYKGGCNKVPTLELSPQYANNSERALSEFPDMGGYTFLATSVSPAYVANCPGVTNIRYALNPMPEKFICRQSGDCFLEATFIGEWQISSQQFKQKQYNNPIYDVNDIYEVLAAGRFDILADYRSFFGFYIETYFGAYSDHCNAYIQDPVGRKIQSVERKYDGSGFLMSEDYGSVRNIVIESQYAGDFDRYFGTSRAWATARIVSSVAASQKRGLGPLNSVSRAIGFFTSNIDKLETIVRTECTSERLLAAQQNMIKFARSQPPVKGKFTTDKKPQNSYPDNASSAPQFSQTYHAEKEKRQQVIRNFHNKENAERTAARQAIIRAEIEARNRPRNAQTTTPVQPRYQPPIVPSGNNPAEKKAKLQSAQTRMMEITQAHTTALTAAMQNFRTKLGSASTNEERQAIQQEFQKFQLEKKQEMQKIIQELLQ